jgi:hypothetical protein
MMAVTYMDQTFGDMARSIKAKRPALASLRTLHADDQTIDPPLHFEIKKRMVRISETVDHQKAMID